MGCAKGKGDKKSKVGQFRCKKCGAVRKKKENLCKPKKIKDKE